MDKIWVGQPADVANMVLFLASDESLAVNGAAVIGPESSWQSGLQTGLTIGVAWIATAYGITYLFEQRSRRLFFINAGYYVVLFAIMGSIIGAWQ